MRVLDVNKGNYEKVLEAVVDLIKPIEDELAQHKADYVDLQVTMTSAVFSSYGEMGIPLTLTIGKDITMLTKAMFALGYRYAKTPHEFEAVMAELRVNLGTVEKDFGKKD